MIQIEFDMKDFLAHMTDLEKRQLPFAVMTGLNITSDEMKERLQHEMRDSFDRPTPYILKGIRIRYARKSELFAEISLQDSLGKARPSQVLQAEIDGGPRRLKAFERQLGGKFTVPGKEMPRNAYGNLPGGLITRALNDSGLLRGKVTPRTPSEIQEALTRLHRSKTRRGARGGSVYLLGKPGGGRLPEGVWERRKVGRYWVIRPVMVFLDRAPVYGPRLEWGFTTRWIFRRQFPINFQQALNYAMATARR